LGEFVDGLPETDKLAELLTMVGLEVEGVERPDPRLVEGLVVARINVRDKHPNADRLSLCTVDDGDGEKQIVCGASNMQAGDSVVLARPGTVLPGGLKIKKSKIRGEVSLGMLCAASELDIAGDEDGIMILGEGVAPGESAAKLLGLDETVIEIGITPNRGDCLSIRGVAREVAAVCEGASLSSNFDRTFETPGGTSAFSVDIEDEASCPTYTGIEIHDVTIAPSPGWLVAKLAACGLRPVNNVVDVTNLVLFEYGQPLHAFDQDLLVGDTIGVRAVSEPVSFQTLDEQERELVAGDLAIWDGEGPIALAGVMGGMRTAVTDETRNIFLESAVFEPRRVRATSRRLGLISDSSYRFERGIDPEGVLKASLRAAHLIAELGGGRVAGGPVVGGKGVAEAAPISLRLARIETLLGIPVPAAEVESILTALGASVTATGDGFEVERPSHRNDLEREVDLIEEVARVHGYLEIPEQCPRPPMLATTVPDAYAFAARVRVRLVALGLQEIVALSFASSATNERFPGLSDSDAKPVRVRNPLRSGEDEMRRSLVPGLLEAHAMNVRNGAERTDLFAVGATFVEGDDERPCVAGVLAGPRRTRGPRDEGDAEFGDAKGVVERIAALVSPGAFLDWSPVQDRPDLHPRESAQVAVNGRRIGVVGALHPDAVAAFGVEKAVQVFEIDTQKLAAFAPPPAPMKPVPKYPASARDVSLLVPDGLFAGDVIAAVRALDEPLLERVSVFDEYKGKGVPEGNRALAFSLVYRSPDETLTDEAVAELHDRIVSGVLDALDVQLRT
jgi:phenylalanyl-tRNA synthetase beta chain